MKEACPVLFEFELFNPEVLDKSKKGRKELLTMLCNLYDTTISYEVQTNTFIPNINLVCGTSEIRAFDEGIAKCQAIALNE